MPRKKETRGGWNRKYRTESQRRKAKQRSDNESHKRTTTAVTFRFHNENDADVLAALAAAPNKADYVRRLIRDDASKGE